MFFGRKGESKKGQFTIFVIVAIVVLFVFAFAFYARIKIVQKTISSQAEVQLADYINKNSINQYVTSCLNVVVDEVFLEAISQGGRITIDDPTSPYYFNQDDFPLKYTDGIIGREFNISTAIEPNEECPSNPGDDKYIVTQEAGLYPYNCKNADLDKLKDIYRSFGAGSCKNNCYRDNFATRSGFFGINNMKILCATNGSNSRKPGITGDNSLTCDYYTSKGNSLQEELQHKIEYEVKKCINFTEIINTGPSNITVDETKVKAVIQFTREQFDVRLEYPFTITIRNKQPVTKMVNFSVNKKIPFKELYEYAYEFVNSDVMDIYFDKGVEEDYKNIKSRSSRRLNKNIYTNDYLIDIIPGTYSNDYVDMVRIIDTNSYILSAPLTINFAIKNRRPALDYIYEGNSEWYDLSSTEGKDLILAPVGIDPDDEPITEYIYSDWKEDYNDKYNYDQQICVEPVPGTSIDQILRDCTEKIPNNNNLDGSKDFPRNWTKSELYEQTEQNAMYKIGEDDKGYHVVTISILDRAELYDYQNIRILVMDAPIADIKGSNKYEEEQPNLKGEASIEDSYTLDASESTVGLIENLFGVILTGFKFVDDRGEFDYTSPEYIEGVELKNILYLPFDLVTDPNQVNIFNINDYIFKITGEHNIELTVTSSNSEAQKILHLNVRKCLPFYETNIEPYPYNTGTDLEARLQGKHACCTEDFEYETESTVCYDETQYGQFEVLSNMVDDTGYFNSNIYDKDKDPSYDYDSNENDIYVREFERYCSGDRGNICTGNRKETVTSYQTCDDTNNIDDPNFRNERCSGIPRDYINRRPASGPISCDPYSQGDTFERISGTGSGNCAIQQRATGGGYFGTFYKYDAQTLDTNKNYNFLCDGQCDGEGGCTRPTNCACDSTDPTLSSGNPSCDGTDYNIITPLNKCGEGKPYFSDTCDGQCGLQDAQNLCKSGGDCTANPYCNNIRPGDYAKNGGSNYCSGKTFIRCGYDIDANACQLYPSLNNEQNICRAACGANIDCDGKTKGSLISEKNPNMINRRYCNSDCDAIDCNGYKMALNTNSGYYECKTLCISLTDCVLGYTCDRTTGSATFGQCV